MRRLILATTKQIILLSEDGMVLEGGSSNIFLDCGDGMLHTAHDGILKGTIREVVMKVCPVVSPTPLCVSTYPTWRGMLICSTTRLALPVDEMIFPEEHGCPRLTFEYPEGALCRQVQADVARSVDAMSRKVLSLS
jgi:branched-subunit amino acid aminotransferase/4-amino-4-deoxychorismate lyase